MTSSEKTGSHWVVDSFKKATLGDTRVEVGVVMALTDVVKASSAKTMMGLQSELQLAALHLKADMPKLSVASICDLFTRFVTRRLEEIRDFDECKQLIIERGEKFREASEASHHKIAISALRFLRDASVVLVHGFSNVVIAVLLHAAKCNTHFSVLATESRPDCVGYKTAMLLQAAGVHVTIITDAAAAHVMDQVDLVLVGAEAIVENGGIINKIGTYQTAIVAHALHKPLYVLAESFKFQRLYPLHQHDFPQQKLNEVTRSTFLKVVSAVDSSIPANPPFEHTFHLTDYTPPLYITLLITDLGVLTPSGVSDELIKLYS